MAVTATWNPFVTTLHSYPPFCSRVCELVPACSFPCPCPCLFTVSVCNLTASHTDLHSTRSPRQPSSTMSLSFVKTSSGTSQSLPLRLTQQYRLRQLRRHPLHHPSQLLRPLSCRLQPRRLPPWSTFTPRYAALSVVQTLRAPQALTHHLPLRLQACLVPHRLTHFRP